MKDIPLTPEQRVFAEKNHNLLLQFLRKRELSIQDYYDVVVFGYLKGVRAYGWEALDINRLEEHAAKPVQLPSERKETRSVDRPGEYSFTPTESARSP